MGWCCIVILYVCYFRSFSASCGGVLGIGRSTFWRKYDTQGLRQFGFLVIRG